MDNLGLYPYCRWFSSRKDINLLKLKKDKLADKRYFLNLIFKTHSLTLLEINFRPYYTDEAALLRQPLSIM